MRVTGIKTKLFKNGFDLSAFLQRSILSLEEGDVVVVTSKVVALSQGRIGKLKDKDYFIKRESRMIIETPWAPLTLTNDGWCINAGIDEKNAAGHVILLPKDSFISAEKIRRTLLKHFSLKKLGVIIADTKSVPLRVGTIGRTLGYAGFDSLKSYIGRRDLFGRINRVTESNVADALSAAAVLVMGEGRESTPLAVISGAPIEFLSKPTLKKYRQLSLSPEDDIFRAAFIGTVGQRKMPKR